MKLIAASSVFAFLAALSIRAGATPGFPADLQADLMLSYQPPCSVCHVNGVTGSGTAQTPFAKSMKDRGLVPANDASLASALTRMETDKVDSDGDTVLDVDELVMGTDPNVADKGAAPTQKGPSVAYGCGARIATRGEAGGAEALAIASIVAASIALASRRAHRFS